MAWPVLQDVCDHFDTGAVMHMFVATARAPMQRSWWREQAAQLDGRGVAFTAQQVPQLLKMPAALLVGGFGEHEQPDASGGVRLRLRQPERP